MNMQKSSEKYSYRMSQQWFFLLILVCYVALQIYYLLAEERCRHLRKPLQILAKFFIKRLQTFFKFFFHMFVFSFFLFYLNVYYIYALNLQHRRISYFHRKYKKLTFIHMLTAMCNMSHKSRISNIIKDDSQHQLFADVTLLWAAFARCRFRAAFRVFRNSVTPARIHEWPWHWPWQKHSVGGHECVCQVWSRSAQPFGRPYGT